MYGRLIFSISQKVSCLGEMTMNQVTWTMHRITKLKARRTVCVTLLDLIELFLWGYGLTIFTTLLIYARIEQVYKINNSSQNFDRRHRRSLINT